MKLLYANSKFDTQEVRFTFEKELPLDEPYLYHRALFTVKLCLTEANSLDSDDYGRRK